MEYFIGSVVTLILLTALSFALRKMPKEIVTISPPSQSRAFELVGRYLVGEILQPKPSQSSNYEASMMLKVFVMKDKAYWIKDNKVFTANIIDDEINSDDGIEVDMMSMSTVQLNEMLFIIDQLKENNDNRNPGQQRF